MVTPFLNSVQHIKAMLWIRDAYPGSRFFSMPDLGTRISDPGFLLPDFFSRISAPGYRVQTKRKGGKKLDLLFFLSYQYHEIEKYFFRNRYRKKTGSQKFFTDLSEIGVGDPKKTYPGTRILIQEPKRHRIPDPDPQHFSNEKIELFSKMMFCSFLFKE
jgi:hypothetical protein